MVRSIQLEETVGSRPVPDPTLLTTDQLRREILALRELIDAIATGLRIQLETRLEGMDKAIVLLQVGSDKFPKLITEAVATLQELHEEKFHSIAIQFAERDTRTEQAAKDSKVAIDAALQAQKEAVGEQNKSNALAISKSEAAFTKQIDQITVIVNSQGKALDDKIVSGTSALDGKIDDIKERISKIETSSLGRINTIEGHSRGISDSWGWLIGAVGLFATLAAVFFLLVDKMK